jgi:hypothetical protein
MSSNDESILGKALMFYAMYPQIIQWICLQTHTTLSSWWVKLSGVIDRVNTKVGCIST